MSSARKETEEQPVSATADLVSETENGTYDEDQWERSIAEGNTFSAKEEEARVPLGESRENRAGGSAPELDELLKKVPASTQELIDSLFRGKFIGVRAFDRNKLY